MIEWLQIVLTFLILLHLSERLAVVAVAIATGTCTAIALMWVLKLIIS
jgi:hypothetical protein